MLIMFLGAVDLESSNHCHPFTGFFICVGLLSLLAKNCYLVSSLIIFIVYQIVKMTFTPVISGPLKRNALLTQPG